MSEQIQVVKKDHEQFGSIRAMVVDGEPWFFAVDVARALGYKRPSDAVLAHCPDSKNINDISIGDSRRSEIIDENGSSYLKTSSAPKVIPESDVYALVISSKLPKARAYRDWVFKEVLPSIRKTGSYFEEPKTNAELLLVQVQLLVDQEKEMQRLGGAVSNIDERVTDLEVTQGDTFDAVDEVALSLTKPSELDFRSKINIAVRKHCKKLDTPSYGGLWNKIYTEFKYREHVDLKARAKNSGRKALDIADELGLMEELWNVASFVIRKDDEISSLSWRARPPRFN